MTTGQRIKEARKAAGMTQKDLAEKLGLAYQTLAQWENNLRNPKFETLEKIATALNVHPGELMGLVNYGDDPWAPGDNIWASPDITPAQLEHLRDLRDQARAVQMSTWGVIARKEEPDIHEEEILESYYKLNDAGKKVARERVEELTEIPRYQKEPQQPPQAPSPQDSETIPEDGEKPPEGC